MAAPSSPDGLAEAFGCALNFISGERPGAVGRPGFGVLARRDDGDRATLGDGLVALAGVEGAISGDAGDLLLGREPVEQLGQHGRVAHIAGGELGSPDLRRLRVNSKLDLALARVRFGRVDGHGLRERSKQRWVQVGGNTRPVAQGSHDPTLSRAITDRCSRRRPGQPPTCQTGKWATQDDIGQNGKKDGHKGSLEWEERVKNDDLKDRVHRQTQQDDPGGREQCVAEIGLHLPRRGYHFLQIGRFLGFRIAVTIKHGHDCRHNRLQDEPERK